MAYSPSNGSQVSLLCDSYLPLNLRHVAQGLIYKEASYWSLMNLNSGLSPVPLKSISVSVSIYEFVADVSATLNYENAEKVPLEAVFLFPMDEDSAVYSFEALVDGKKIVAELQDKMKVVEITSSLLITLPPPFLVP